MAKQISFSKRLSSIFFWSIISAAFIGPGTVTTASKAGSSYGLALLWALLFSTIATIILQEAAARITIGSGKSLGEIIAIRYGGSSGQLLRTVVFGAVAFGCAAYQAGNILGAISGLSLVTALSTKVMILGVGLICGILLWIGNFRIIANMLGLIVAVMGVAFIYSAMQSGHGMGTIFSNSLVPSFPEDSTLLIIGLIGTTIVPYNLFLASGLSKGQSITEMRVGIGGAVIIGGLISMAILIVGTQVEGDFSFQALSDTLTGKMGQWGGVLFGFGLFAAGLSSSITAPLAAAVTAQSLFEKGDQKWGVRSRNFRLVWGSILLIGLTFGLMDIKPIPAIILAQAINGMLLPIVAIFLIFAVNDRRILGEAYINSIGSNLITLLLVGVACFLGILNIMKALTKVLGSGGGFNLSVAGVATVLLLVWVGYRLYRNQEGGKGST